MLWIIGEYGGALIDFPPFVLCVDFYCYLSLLTRSDSLIVVGYCATSPGLHFLYGEGRFARIFYGKVMDNNSALVNLPCIKLSAVKEYAGLFLGFRRGRLFSLFLSPQAVAKKESNCKKQQGRKAR